MVGAHKPLSAEPDVPASEADVVPGPAGDRLSDIELVQRARMGDAWAFEALFRRHVRAVMGTVTRALGRREEARDIVQDTFATAFTELEKLRTPEAFRVWLRHIAVRKVYRALEKQRWLRLIGLAKEEDDDAPLAVMIQPGAPPEVSAELALLDRVLRTLPPQPRLAWVLRFIDGEPLENVARMLGVSVATAKRRINEAQLVIDEHVKVGGRRG